MEGLPDQTWHTLPTSDVEAALATGTAGLSLEEATRRLERYGPNEVEQERETPWWKLLLHQFRDPLIYILLVAALVTLVLQDYTDTGVILAVVLLNALIGYTQESRAQQEMRALTKLSAPHAEVIRDASSHDVLSRELVPGDMVLLAAGVRVPADIRLTHTADLQVDESALTGESLATRKTTETLTGDGLVPGDQHNMAFAGTVVTRGRGRGIVVRTGAATELGQIAHAVREIGHTATPLQRKVEAFGRAVGWAVLGLSAVVVGVGLLRGMPAAEIFVTAVAVAVSAIPEGLPVVLTVTLAIGVRRMAARQAIIRALPAVETLGSTTVIGSDKTGTLTKNEMTVRALWAGGQRYALTGAGYAPEGEVLLDGVATNADADAALRESLLALVLANEANADAFEAGEPIGDPTELALYVAAAKAGMHPGPTRTTHAERDMLPFESERRLMATLNEGPGGLRIFVKGAPEAVLARCTQLCRPEGAAPLDAEAVREAAAAMAGAGLRVLAAAYREAPEGRLDEASLGGDFVLAGLVGMEDPVRPEAVTAVADAHAAGIRVLMITGDHADTARAIGDQLGLDGDGVLVGHQLDGLSDEELDRALVGTNVFARVAPEHKLRVVERLKARGEVIAVTGDGVNDAPALRAAHLGIAMGRGGTDVAREASDMVLADDNFATITAAVEEGRVVFANVRKVTFFLLSTAVGEVITILAALAFGWPLPFVAAQILWINLVTNGLQDVALAFEPGEPGLLGKPPRPLSERIVTLRLLERLVGVGLVLTLGTLGMFWWAWEQTGDLDFARTVAMTQMVVFQFFHVFNSRSLDRSIFRVPPFSNPLLFASLVAAALAHLAVLHVSWLQRVFRTVPLDLETWGLIALVGSAVVLGAELDKAWNRRRDRPLG